MRYKDFVDPDILGSFKKELLGALMQTLPHPEWLGIRVVPESIGEAALLFDFVDYDFMLALTNDGVGTKSRIADYLATCGSARVTPFYEHIAMDLVYANTNDLLCVGAVPFAATNEIAAGGSSWFANKRNAKDMQNGFVAACASAEVAMCSGETAVLQGLLPWEFPLFSGAALGIVRPKRNAILGEELADGDIILGLASNGMHTNGLSLARSIAERFVPQGLQAELPNGKTLAETLLDPTRDYRRVIQAMRETGISFHYLSHITGGGWRKIMRAKQPFTYMITRVPEPPFVFRFLQTHGEVSDYEAYQTWNMGMGFAIILPESHVAKAHRIARTHGIKSAVLGHIEEGKKQVIIKPKDIVYQ